MLRQRLTRWIGALLAFMMLGMPASVFADHGNGRGPFQSQLQEDGPGGGPLGGVLGGPAGRQCTRFAAALQIAPNLVYYPGPLAAAQACGLPVQQATTPPVCTHLADAVRMDPSLRRFSGVNTQLRQCLTQGSIQVVNATNTFSDLGGYQWALADINQLVTLGIFQGMGGGLFAPAGHLTRAQFAALMVRIFNLPQPAASETFSDVPTSFWAYADIEAAASYMSTFAGIGGGTPAFEPSLDVTRIEVAATIGKIMNTLNASGNPLPTLAQAEATFGQFSDASQVPQGLEPYAALAVTLGFMKGYGNGAFGVNDPLTRAEAAVLLDRVLRTTESMNGTTPPTATTTTATGTFYAYSSTTITLTVNGTQVPYTLGSTYTVELNGQSEGSGLTALTQADLNGTDTVTLTLTDNAVTGISATNSSTTTTTATGTFYTYTSTTITLTVNGTQVPYTLGSTYTVELNGQSEGSGLTALTQADLNGSDTVTLTLTGNAVTDISATNSSTTTTTATGTFYTYTSTTITLTVNGTQVPYTLGSTYTIYLNSVQQSSLAVLGTADSVTLTLVNGDVTEVNATSETTTSTVQGYIVYVPSTVSLTVYGTSGLMTETATSTPAVTVDGSNGSLTSVLVGDDATLTLTGGQLTAVAATTPSQALTSGSFASVTETNGVWQVNFDGGNIPYVTVGSVAPTLIEAGAVVSGIAVGTQVTIVEDAVNGAALVIAQ